MRALVISEFMPHDPARAVFGAFQRLRLLLDAVAGLGELDLLFLQPRGVDGSAASAAALAEALAQHWGLRALVFLCEDDAAHAAEAGLRFSLRCLQAGAVTFFPQRLSLDSSRGPCQSAVERALEREPDIVLAHRLGAMAPLLLRNRALPPIVLDLDDVEHIRAFRMVGTTTWGRRRLLGYGSVPVLVWSERCALARARLTLVCSEADNRRLLRLGDPRRVAVLPNAVALPEVPPLPASPTLLFLGTYGYRPNADAAEWLLREIWPLVKRAVPEARLILAGPEWERIRGSAVAGPDVEVPGFVQDLVCLYRRTRLVCCPLRAGSGTRVKILEAAAFGRPIVATTLGAEGLDMRKGRELLVEDDPVAMAEACVQLLRDEALCARLGGAARAAVSERYERSALVRSAMRLIAGALPGGRRYGIA